MVQLTREEKESGVITTAIFAIVLLLLFVLKFDVDKEDDKKEEVVVMLEDEGGGGGGGVAVNFGDSDNGLGAKYQSDAVAKAPPAQSAPAEEVVGSSDDRAEAVANTQPVKNRDPKPQTPKPAVEDKPKAPVKPSNAALDAIMNGSNTGGSGNTTAGGNQGSNNGLSNGNYGTGGSGGGSGGGTGSGNGTGTGPGSGSGSGGGSGSGRGTGVGNYKMAGRKPLSTPKPKYNCNEEGVVVVEVYANPAGKVISATAGVRGTTNSASCLLTQAKAAAMETTWTASADAPDKQTGTIIYNFKLTD